MRHSTRSQRLLSSGLLLSVLLLSAACVAPLLQPAPAPTFTPTPAVDTNAAANTPTPEAPAAAPVNPADRPDTPPLFDPAAVDVRLEPLADGFARPLLITHAGDGSGRLFVVEQAGAIHIVENGQRLEEPFLAITDRVNDGASEQGLLGLAFPPDFDRTGFFFVNYTDSTGDTQVARFSVAADTPNQADPASEFTVLTVDQPAGNHNGGMLVFGPDGYLYIGMGDGGGANDTYKNAQNPATLLGKLLRIDVTSDPTRPYIVPPDNPWVNQDWNGVDVRDEVWAMGLRNPWRFSFDRATGDLWIGDVGQGQYEEVDYIAASTPAPHNFGWPVMEGLHCVGKKPCDQEAYTLPVVEYDHSGRCSVTGGYVYRGSAWPALTGAYVYGDYCSGTIWVMGRTAAGGWASTTAVESDLSISSFGEDEQGELYVADLSGGAVLRLVAE